MWIEIEELMPPTNRFFLTLTQVKETDPRYKKVEVFRTIMWHKFTGRWLNKQLNQVPPPTHWQKEDDS